MPKLSIEEVSREWLCMNESSCMVLGNGSGIEKAYCDHLKILDDNNLTREEILDYLYGNPER